MKGDIVEITKDQVICTDDNNTLKSLKITHLEIPKESITKGEYKHYMLKEIYEQPNVARLALKSALDGSLVDINQFGKKAGSCI